MCFGEQVVFNYSSWARGGLRRRSRLKACDPSMACASNSRRADQSGPGRGGKQDTRELEKLVGASPWRRNPCRSDQPSRRSAHKALDVSSASSDAERRRKSLGELQLGNQSQRRLAEQVYAPVSETGVPCRHVGAIPPRRPFRSVRNGEACLVPAKPRRTLDEGGHGAQFVRRAARSAGIRAPHPSQARGYAISVLCAPSANLDHPSVAQE
jgi:hypothetical protein